MKDEAFNLLTLINNEEIDNNTNIHDILITFEDTGVYRAKLSIFYN
jgi:hypothetical protein